MAMATFDATWDFAALSNAVCDTLVEQGKIRAKPTFIRGDRQTKIAETFEKCGLDGAKMAGLNGATVKTTVRAVTQGEGWVHDVETVLIAMLSDESQADKTAAAESADAKAIREANLERVKGIELGDGERQDNRECFNCGEVGHLSAACPNERSARGGGSRDDAAFRSFNGGGGDRECYNCGQTGHISRECPESNGGGGGYGGGGGGGGDRACYNCGQMGHISRECHEGSGGGGGY